jgi:hypothetical protein
MDKVFIRDLLVRGIIGVNDWERREAGVGVSRGGGNSGTGRIRFCGGRVLCAGGVSGRAPGGGRLLRAFPAGSGNPRQSDSG